MVVGESLGSEVSGHRHVPYLKFASLLTKSTAMLANIEHISKRCMDRFAVLMKRLPCTSFSSRCCTRTREQAMTEILTMNFAGTPPNQKKECRPQTSTTCFDSSP